MLKRNLLLSMLGSIMVLPVSHQINSVFDLVKQIPVTNHLKVSCLIVNFA